MPMLTNAQISLFNFLASFQEADQIILRFVDVATKWQSFQSNLEKKIRFYRILP